VAAVLAGAAALAWYGGDLSGWQRVACWSVLGLALAYLQRSGIVRLFGPVLFYDLVRNARRTRTYVLRCGYLALLLLFLWSVVGSQIERRHYYRDEVTSSSIDPQEMAALAEAFFATFMAVQFFLVVFLTPAYVAGAIAEEKERKTLEFLLATDLDSREIVLGKLVARLGYLTLLVLTGLPVLSAVQFLGGVDPGLVLAGFAATALTVASLAGVSILASVYARRSRDAIMRTYLAVGVYCGLCLVGSFLLHKSNLPDEINSLLDATLYDGWPSPRDCVRYFQVGNPGYALYDLFSRSGTTVEQALPPILRAYALFHILLTAVTVTLAVARLRPVALRESSGPKKGQARLRATRSLAGDPMVWKEMHYSSGTPVRRWTAVLFGLLVILSFLPVPYLVITSVSSQWGERSALADASNIYVRVVGTIVACVGLIGAAVRGSVAVRTERDKDTLDALLTSPLSTREILFGKWAGCLWGLRWTGVWLGAIYLWGVLTGGVSPVSVPLLATVILIYSGALTAVGLWCSVVCRTTTRATVAAVFAALGLSVGHWMIWLCCVPFAGGRGSEMETVIKLQAGMTPPFVLAALPLGSDDMGHMTRSESGEAIVYGFIGTIAWAGLGFLFWAILNDRFQSETNRSDVSMPEGRAPGPGPQATGKPAEP
jgi:ABC-type transport system involved in multi-copper enzyme maturation permease subunit